MAHIGGVLKGLRPWGRRGAAAALVLALAGAGVAGSAGAAPDPDRARAARLCASPQYVPAQGWGCPTAHGWKLPLDDGTVLTTHGPDYVPAAQAGTLSSAPLKPSCVTNPSTQFHLRALYVYASDQKSRYPSLLGEIRKMLEIMNGALNDEAKLFKAGSTPRTLRYRMYCSGGEVSVAAVQIGVTKKAADFTSIVQQIRAKGYTNPLAKYLVWFDGEMPIPGGIVGGMGTFIDDTNPGASNANNYGAGYTVVFGRRLNDPLLSGPIVFMHESGHNFGAVSLGSPHTTSAGHCNDGIDVMCYDDGGANANYTDTACRSVRFDCGHDDYFNPAPGSTNFLYDHWQIGTPFNRFVAGCVYATGMLTAGGAGQAVDGTTSTLFSVGSTCAGRRFGLSGIFMPPPQDVAATTGVPWDGLGPGSPSAITVERTVTPDFNVCFYKGTATISCAQAVGEDSGTIPSGTTKARVFLNVGAQSIFVFNAI